MYAKMYLSNEMKIDIRSELPRIYKLSGQEQSQKQLVLGNISDLFVTERGQMPGGTQQEGLKCSVKWGSEGEKAIDVKLPSCKIVAEPGTLFGILHIFLEG